MNWRWISVTALLAALVIGYGALMRGRPEPAAGGEQPAQPGYYLQDAIITQTEQDGSVGLRLTVDRIEQQRTDDSIALSSVRASYFQNPERTWLLSAQQGLVPGGLRVLQLHGDVELRPANADSAAFLRTEALAIDMPRGIAYSTTSPVRIRFGQHGMTVKSFHADLNSEKIRLESVNGRFEPQ